MSKLPPIGLVGLRTSASGDGCRTITATKLNDIPTNFGQITIIALVRPTALTAGARIAVKDPSNTEGWRFTFSGTGGNILAGIRGSTPGSWDTSDTPLSRINEWYWVAWTWNNANSAGARTNFYTARLLTGVINKSALSGNTDVVTPSSDAGNVVAWGTRDATNNTLPGDLALGAIFTREFSYQDIAEFIKNPAAFRRSAVQFLRFGAYGKSRNQDESGNGYSTTIEGATKLVPDPLNLENILEEPDYPDTFFKVVAGTGNYTQSLGGGVTPSGAVTNDLDPFSILKGGGVTPTGDLPFILIGMNDGALEGSVTPTGGLSLDYVAQIAGLEGGVVPFGNVDMMAGITPGGGVTPTGTLHMPDVMQTLTGSVTPTGALSGGHPSLIVGDAANRIIPILRKKKK